MGLKHKRLEELEIWDDFMFGAVMRNKGLCKPLLEMILRKKIKDIQYPELQKTIDKQYDAKSIRLDVYVEDDIQTVYNIEIQTTNKKNLPKRTRYYQGIIDLNILDKGEDYNKLRKSFIIFICNYDPFGKGRCMYRFENICVDDPMMKLGDDSVKIIINPFGKSDDRMGKGFKSFMEFLKSGKPNDSYTEALAKEMDYVKSSEEWRREYMTLIMRDKENQRIGDLSRGVRQVKNNMGKYSVEELSAILGFDVEIIENMIRKIEMHPDWEAEDIAWEILDED